MGLKLDDVAHSPEQRVSFRRTLVGLKHEDDYDDDKMDEGFRRTLVGLKPILGVVRFGVEVVSDEPLWG